MSQIFGTPRISALPPLYSSAMHSTPLILIVVPNPRAQLSRISLHHTHPHTPIWYRRDKDPQFSHYPPLFAHRIRMYPTHQHPTYTSKSSHHLHRYPRQFNQRSINHTHIRLSTANIAASFTRQIVIYGPIPKHPRSQPCGTTQHYRAHHYPLYPTKTPK